MKNIFLAATILLFAFGCKKDQPTTLVEPVVTTGTKLAMGSFQSAVHPTSGTATVRKKEMIRSLIFENFKTDPGPDLDVYLAKDLSGTSFINLGDLKATSGTFQYTIDKSIDLTSYKYVLIWCVDFKVLFGSALLQ